MERAPSNSVSKFRYLESWSEVTTMTLRSRVREQTQRASTFSNLLAKKVEQDSHPRSKDV